MAGDPLMEPTMKKIIRNVIDLDEAVSGEKPDLRQVVLICNESILKARNKELIELFMRIKYNAENLLALGQQRLGSKDGELERLIMIKQDTQRLKELINEFLLNNQDGGSNKEAR